MCSAKMSQSSQESSNSESQAFRMGLMPSGNMETPDTPCSGDYLSMQPFLDFEEIDIKEKCGHGSYGVVYKAIWRDRYVAVKEFVATAEQTAIEREVKQLSRVCHENIISLYGISAHNQSKYLVMEYAEGGCLYNFLHGKVKPHYQPAHAISWALQCAKGVAYLHAMQPNPLIHRDLKPLNLLLTDKGRHLKICDFGTVADKSTMMTNNRGSAAWMAPEVFEGSKYTEKCDTFSWGIVLWEVLSRKQPFSEIDNSLTIMWKIHKGERPEINKDWPLIIQNLMTSCWKTKPEYRPSMQNVVSEMLNLSTSYTGADEPLEYEFKDQQIIRTDSYADTNDCDDNYTLDFSIYTSSSNNTASTQVTPTNTTSHSNSSSASTPTNVAATVELFNQHANMPTPSITTTRWDVIKEEPETTTYDVNDSEDVFNLTPSAASAKRFETIRNDMIQLASVPMPPLSLEVDPHAWDLSSNSSNNSFAKNDGKERLTVTDAKPMITNSNLSNRNARLNNRDEVETDEDENDGTDQSLAEMLDPELQPEPPIPNNTHSQEIYLEHRRLAKEYLQVDTKLYYAQDFKDKLLIQMPPQEREQKQELLKKMSEKEELMELYNNLKLQLETMRAGQTETVAPTPMPSQRQISQNEVVAEDGWVVVPPSSQNT